MKLITYTFEGKVNVGAVVDDGIINVTEKFSQDVSSIKKIIKLGLFDEIEKYLLGRKPELSNTEITFLPVIPDPEKIFCVGLNYQEHKKETGRPDVENPTIFTRFPNTQIGHLQSLVKPKFSQKFDYEGELAVIIGQGGRYIPEKDALNHIAGYTCFNDGSIRDWQRHTSQFTPGKNFPGTGPLGPYLVTTDEIRDYKSLPIETRLNGVIMQKASLSDLIFPIPKLINYISSFTNLCSGDVIVTGTPGGVGDKRNPPVYMKPGDVVEVDIGPVGVLKNFVIEG